MQLTNEQLEILYEGFTKLWNECVIPDIDDYGQMTYTFTENDIDELHIGLSKVVERIFE